MYSYSIYLSLRLTERGFARQKRWIYFVLWPNKCTIISQTITPLHDSTLSCHPQTACNQYLAKLHKYLKCSCW